MSEWSRNDRDNQMGGRGPEDRYRRESGGRDRWQGRGGESRSFGEDDQGGYGMARFEGSQALGDTGGQGRFGGEGYGRSQGDRQPGGAYRGGGRYQGGSYQGSGQSGPYGGPQDWRGGGSYGGASDYGAQRYGGGYGRGGEAFGDPNEYVRSAADGEGEPGMFGFRHGHAGEHRGRGPKNYTRSDDRIREDVNDRLSDDSWLDASEIEVQVSSCEVTLTGTVNSREDKRRAEDLAEHVSGVKHVQNNLRVQPSGAQTGQGQGTGQSASIPQAGSTTGQGGTGGGRA